MYQKRDLERIVKNITDSIEQELSSIGIFFRIFSRIKLPSSMEAKIQKKGIEYYDGINKFIRDIIGIRIVLYFSDDLKIVYEKLKSNFILEEETIDEMEETKFAPTRVNLVFKLPIPFNEEFTSVVQSEIIDKTFEIQLRTILSEGWHEIDHDLRYKCLGDWTDNNDLSRNLNGILASLETSEYAILSLFEQLSYRHYKLQNIEAMLKTKFRVRFHDFTISDVLKGELNPEIIKEIYKLNRIEVLNFLLDRNLSLPLTMDNFIFIINCQFIKNQRILDITSKLLLEEMRA